ncbi:MAG: ATP-dependent helicase, partial [Ginsengibacter sp.]
DMEERAFLRDIHKLIDQTIPVAEGHPFASTIKFVQTPVVQNNPMQRRPASHSGFRRARSWSQGR